MYVSTTLFSAVSFVSGFLDITTISPACIFSIATNPVAVNIIVPATKQVIVVVIPPVNTAVAVTPI